MRRRRRVCAAAEANATAPLGAHHRLYIILGAHTDVSREWRIGYFKRFQPGRGEQFNRIILLANPHRTLEYTFLNFERTVRCSSVLIGALGLSLIALAVYTAVLVLAEYKSPRPCITEECVATASRMIESLNKDVDPCTDFYEFACGGWIKKNPVPEWASSWDQLAKLREQLVIDLRELLEADDEKDLPESVMKAKSLYRTCINIDKLEEDGIKPIQKVLEKLELPPLPPRSPTANFTWVVAAGRARRMLGLNVLLSVQVAEDVRNTSRNRIVIEQVSPGFSDRYLLQPEQFAHEVGQYRKYIRDVIALSDPTINADGFADDIVEFSKSLAKIMTPVEVRRSGTHLFHEVSMQQLIQGSNGGPAEWKSHDWERYMSLVFANTSVSLQGVTDRVIVMDLPYLHKLATLLADAPPLLLDDLQIYCEAPLSRLNEAIANTNFNLQLIAEWSRAFGLSVNPVKTQTMIVGSSRLLSRVDTQILPKVVFEGVDIPFSQTVKNLGVVMDGHLGWGPQLQSISRKLYASAALLRRLRNFLPTTTKVALAQSLLLPVLDYADACYLDLSEDQLNKLERLQNFCIRFIFGLRKYDHVSNYRSELKWLPIRLRRNSRLLSLLYNILFNPTYPHYLKERFSFLHCTNSYTLRSSESLSLEIPSHCTSFYDSSFTVQAARLWNSLPVSIRQAKSLQIFKNSVKEFYLSQ
ncbi:unnamed protein product [Diatraea saccharalis]|uniref:Peptidase M13 N-terminal domain-containing protein n=1 Tax=Diatraea saccharalis TaxID=40085 RepID=A0A9N9R8I7_9NEOP|nr:unnamed protein product [Diatraea saccharalis]